MRRIQAAQRFPKLRDILASQHSADIQIPRHQRRSVEYSSESAKDDEVDVSGAKNFDELVELSHGAVCPPAPFRA